MAGLWELIQQSNNKSQGNDDSVDKVTAILNQNKNKNFVQRIMKPDAEMNPLLMNSDGPNTHGTHLMSSGEADGKGIAYPEIVQMKDGSLKRLGRDEAWDYAKKNKEYIEFKTPEEAEWFGKNYKSVWGGNYNKPQAAQGGGS